MLSYYACFWIIGDGKGTELKRNYIQSPYKFQVYGKNVAGLSSTTKKAKIRKLVMYLPTHPLLIGSTVLVWFRIRTKNPTIKNNTHTHKKKTSGFYSDIIPTWDKE